MKELTKIFKDKKFLKEIAIILIVGIVVNALCFLMPLVVHAENYEYFPIVSGQNDNGLTINQNYINERFNNGAIFIHAYPDTRNPDYTYYAVIYDLQTLDSNINPLLYAEIPSASQQNFSLQFNVNSFQNTITFKVDFVRDYNDGTSPSLRSTDNTTLAQFQNMTSSSYSGSKHVYFSTYNINLNSPSNSDQVVLYSMSNSVNNGGFVDLPPLEEVLNDIVNTWEPPQSTGHALPSEPTENPNNTPFQDRLQMFNYIKDSITANVGNLGANLKNWFDNMQKKMTDTTNAVLGGMHDGFSTINENFKEFFGEKLDDILDKVEYIQEPFSAEELADNLNNADFSSDFLGLTTTVSTFGSALTSGSEPNSCSFTLDFSNSYYDFGVCEFSLDWILPFRSGIRLIVGCLCVYSLIVSIFTSLNTYIGGTSSINDDI